MEGLEYAVYTETQDYIAYNVSLLHRSTIKDFFNKKRCDGLLVSDGVVVPIPCAVIL